MFRSGYTVSGFQTNPFRRDRSFWLSLILEALVRSTSFHLGLCQRYGELPLLFTTHYLDEYTGTA